MNKNPKAILVKQRLIEELEELDFDLILSKMPMAEEDKAKLESIVFELLKKSGGDLRRIDNMSRKAKFIVSIIHDLVEAVVRPEFSEALTDNSHDAP
jgi:hypothetical protein